jgi:tetratricopeptide (TPR) repeat protein
MSTVSAQPGSKRPMRRLSCALLLLLLTASACAPRRPAPIVTPAAPTPPERLASADALVRAGCLDCLIAAYGEYDLLRGFPFAKDAATAGAIRTAALIARRERELGLVDEGYGERARALLAGAVNLPNWLPTLLDVIDVLPPSSAGMVRTPTSDIELQRMRVLRSNHDAWSARLRELAPIDELGAYVWLAFTCGATETSNLSLDTLFEPVAPFRDTPLIGFKRATCRGVEAAQLQALLDRDPRFAETKYYLGLSAVGGRQLDEADRRFEEAYAWREQWPTLTQSIANVAMTSEEFERALAFYDRTIVMEPHAVDALLGRVRALTFLGRNVDAIAAVDQLLADRWFVGDARYWRALNESELERNDEAWTDIEAAAKLLVNADVPKLAGLIAYRRHELDVSRAKFEQANTRNPNDCETRFYLGVVLAEQGVWNRTAEVLVDTGRCLENAERGLNDEIAAIRASTDPPARQARKIARREQFIAKGRRMMATSWFDIAVAYYNLSRKVEARQFADKVANDEQFGERARDILSRLK